MKPFSKDELKTFQQAIHDDYRIELPESELHKAAFDLLMFVETLVKFDMEEKNNKNDQKVRKSS